MLVSSHMKVTRLRTPMWLERTSMVSVTARVCASMNCARFMSFQKVSIAARTTPVVRPACAPLPLGSHSWCSHSPFQLRRTQE